MGSTSGMVEASTVILSRRRRIGPSPHSLPILRFAQDDNQVGVIVDAGASSWRQDGGRLAFLNDAWPPQRHARAEGLAFVGGYRDEASGFREIGLALAFG